MGTHIDQCVVSMQTCCPGARSPGGAGRTMSSASEIVGILSTLKDVAPAGYAIALHIHFTTPMYLFQSYPREWVDKYSQEGLVLHDPTVRWGFGNTGPIRWSELAADDEAGVLIAAQKHGLSFGMTVAQTSAARKSIASFARSDREFSDTEVAQVCVLFDDLIQRTIAPGALTDQDQEFLRRMSVAVTRG